MYLKNFSEKIILMCNHSKSEAPSDILRARLWDGA